MLWVVVSFRPNLENLIAFGWPMYNSAENENCSTMPKNDDFYYY